MPGTTVEVAFELTIGDTPYFRLDDPVKGKLNNTSYRLAGPIWIDITDRVANVSIKRGKNRELERYNAGNASITLHNEDRTFDPLNTSSPYVGNIIPRRAVRVTTSGVPQFTGVIEDWNLDYDVSGKSNAQIVAADAFTLLAQQSLTAGTATAQTTGERVNAVLSMPSVAWPLTQRNIDTGSSQVGADVWTVDDNALTYLQEVEASEQGQLFMDRNGYVRFVNGAVTPTTEDAWSLVATNLVTNPSMEAASGTVTVRTNLATNNLNGVNSTNISMSRMTLSLESGFVRGTITDPLAASNAQRVQSTSALTGAVVTAGQTYTFSAYGRASTGANLMRITVLWYQSDGTTLISAASGPDITINSSTFTRIACTLTAPAGAAYANWNVGLSGTGARAIGDTVDFQKLQIEVGSSASDYFDGSTAASGDFTYAWSGTAHASTSLQRGVPVTGATTTAVAAIQSADWYSSGSKSVRIVPTGSSISSRFRYSITTEIGKTYTAKAKIRLTAPLIGTLASQSRTIRLINLSIAEITRSAQAPNTTGIHDVSVTFTAVETTTYVELWNGASAGNGDVWWDDLLIVEDSYTGDYFDGSTTSTFTNRYSWTGTPNASTSLKEFTTYPLFSDSGDGIPYTSATISYGTELLYNQVKVTSPTATSIANNEASQAIYGITTTDVETLLSTSNAVASLALFWVAKYGEPEYRFQDLEISLDGLSAADVEKALNIELGDIVQIKFTPNGVGDSIQRYGQVNKIEHSITPDRHNIVFGFGSLQFSFLVLDDTGFGILNENVLAF